MLPMSKYVSTKGETVVMEGTADTVKIKDVEFKRQTKMQKAIADVSGTGPGSAIPKAPAVSPQPTKVVPVPAPAVK